MTLTHLIYIHGFNSSPQAMKASLIARYLENTAGQARMCFHCPVVPDLPDQAVDALVSLVEGLIEQSPAASVALIGSSLGGFYAAYLAERFQLRAVLVNPAVYPYQRFQAYLGLNHNPYSGNEYILNECHIDALRQIDIAAFSAPEKIQIMVQTGDEVLDYSEAIGKYAQCPHIIESGGDHHFTGFEQYIPQILEFLAQG
jgi:hypothetical protein